MGEKRKQSWVVLLYGFGYLFAGTAVALTIADNVSRPHPFDPGAALAIAALGAIGIVAAVAAKCLKQIDVRLNKLETVRQEKGR